VPSSGVILSTVSQRASASRADAPLKSKVVVARFAHGALLLFEHALELGRIDTRRQGALDERMIDRQADVEDARLGHGDMKVREKQKSR
jgi:hypothetical protein